MTQKVYHDGNLIGASVDYITATASAGRGERSLYRLGERLVGEAISDGNEQRVRSALGYDWLESGGISVGSSPRGAILRVSGPRASSACNETLRHADNVSRIDLQSTVRFARDVSGLARAHAEELQRVQRERLRRITARLERTYGKGDTLYVGSRVSNYFGRIYDKHRESKQDAYRKCWRYEVECKGDGAQKAARLVAAYPDDPTAIAASVGAWFRRRGITPRYRSDVAVELGPIGAKDSDDLASLAWLARGVSPLVMRLALRYGEAAVVDVLFSRRTPAELEPMRVEADISLEGYDAWTIANGGQL